MPRVPRWAEKIVSARCSWGDAVATIPDEDVNGWDLFVEFPDRSNALSEFSPARRHAFAQVKSTTGSQQRASLKLSNMLKGCGSPDPWFIFLVRKDGRIYGQEIDRELMFRAMKQIRRARLDGSPLHRSIISLSFTSEQLIEGDVVEWMEKRIGPSSAAYAEEKTKHFRSVGYGRNSGTGKFVLSSSSEDDFTDNFLGLGRGLQVERMSYVDNRFGMPEPTLDLVQKGTLFFDPVPLGPCHMKITGPRGETPMALTGTVFGFKPPMAASTDGSLRFSSPPLEIVASGTKARLILKNDPSQRYGIDHFTRHVRLLNWMRTSTIKVEVRRATLPRWESTFKQTNPNVPQAFADVVNALDVISAHVDLSTFSFSIDDLTAALPTIHDAALLLANQNLRLEADHAAFDAESLRAVRYVASSALGGAYVAAIVERPVTEDRILTDTRQLTLGKLNVIDAYFWEGGQDDYSDFLDEELKRLPADDPLTESETLLVGDVMARISESRQR